MLRAGENESILKSDLFDHLGAAETSCEHSIEPLSPFKNNKFRKQIIYTSRRHEETLLFIQSCASGDLRNTSPIFSLLALLTPGGNISLFSH